MSEPSNDPCGGTEAESVQLTVKLPKSLNHQLNVRAAHRHISKQELLAEILTFYFSDDR